MFLQDTDDLMNGPLIVEDEGEGVDTAGPQRLQCVVVPNFKFQQMMPQWGPMPVANEEQVANLLSHMKSVGDPAKLTMSEKIGKDMPYSNLRRIAFDFDKNVAIADHTVDHYNDYKTKAPSTLTISKRCLVNSWV
jgi:hypothetical protein